MICLTHLINYIYIYIYIYYEINYIVFFRGKINYIIKYVWIIDWLLFISFKPENLVKKKVGLRVIIHNEN